MSRKFLVAAAVAVALLIPIAARAHGGHVHKVMGTVQSVQGDHVQIKTTDGKTVMVMLASKTTVTRGTTKLDRAAIAVGERVSIDYMQEKDMFMAQAVKLGAVTQAAKK
jgi:hypothetical protein